MWAQFRHDRVVEYRGQPRISERMRRVGEVCGRGRVGRTLLSARLAYRGTAALGCPAERSSAVRCGARASSPVQLSLVIPRSAARRNLQFLAPPRQWPPILTGRPWRRFWPAPAKPRDLTAFFVSGHGFSHADTEYDSDHAPMRRNCSPGGAAYLSPGRKSGVPSEKPKLRPLAGV